MVDVVFLGFVVNLYGSPWVIDFGFCGCCFSGFCGESLWVSMGFSGFSAFASVFYFLLFFYFFQWWWLRWICVC